MQFEKEILRFCEILDEEIKHINQDESKDYVLTEGKFVKEENNCYIYIFNTEYEIRLTDSFPVTIKVKGINYEADIISIEKTKIVLSFKRKINNEIDKVFLKCNPVFLLEGLRSRLLECQNKTSSLARVIVEDGIVHGHQNEIAKKESLYDMIENNKITFIWGPPGTGKTTTLGNLVKRYAVEKKKILILSHSNTAVDEAILKILVHFKDSKLLEDGKIIRHGYIQKNELKEQYGQYCDVYSYALKQNQKLKEKLLEIEKRIKQFTEGEKNETVTILKKEKNSIYLQLLNEREQLIKNASIIGTTISKATIDELVYNQYFDIVFFDEASMAYIPQIIFAASLAVQKFICIGDMRQLAPISKVEELRKDIYSYLNMVDENNNVSHPWLVMLDKQYRCHPMISKFVNKEFYLNKMENGVSKETDFIKQIVDLEPFSGRPLTLLDTSGFYASACITLEYSRINIVDACIAVITATRAYKATKKSIGIVTPYAAQARLIRKLLKDDLGKRKYDITCSTVHQFQGDEKDIIIFDTVESYPNEKLGQLTSNNKGNAIDRLVNVAITRAKGKLIVIGNYSYWKNYAYPNNSFLKLMKYIERQDKSFIIGAEQLKRFIEKSRIGKIRFWDDDDNAAYAFIEDIRAAKDNINIMLATGNEINSSCLKELKSLADSDSNIKIEIKSPTDQKQLTGLNKFTYITKRDSLPISIIDNNVVWYGIPDMNRYYDLKTDNHIYEYNKIMIRIDGKHIACTLDELLDFRNDLKILNKKSNGDNLKKYVQSQCCADCGKNVYLVHEKHFYVHCPHCMKKYYLQPNVVNSFFSENNIVCPNDGGKLRAILGPYGLLLRCSEHHNIQFNDFFEIE